MWKIIAFIVRFIDCTRTLINFFRFMFSEKYRKSIRQEQERQEEEDIYGKD